MMNWIWLGAVVAFGVLEAATAALVSIWFVGGAAVALLASFLGAALLRLMRSMRQRVMT